MRCLALCLVLVLPVFGADKSDLDSWCSSALSPSAKVAYAAEYVPHVGDFRRLGLHRQLQLQKFPNGKAVTSLTRHTLWGRLIGVPHAIWGGLLIGILTGTPLLIVLVIPFKIITIVGRFLYRCLSKAPSVQASPEKRTFASRGALTRVYGLTAIICILLGAFLVQDRDTKDILLAVVLCGGLSAIAAFPVGPQGGGRSRFMAPIISSLSGVVLWGFLA